MAGIFISYRRDDSRHAAGRLGDDLALSFGAPRIFRDVESIDPGIDFEVALDQALKNCAVMLVVIGPRWLDITDAEGRRRLDQEGDWIRIEVSRALQRQVRVIPVLLEDTPLPTASALPETLQPLVRRQALPLSDARWRGDLQRLVETLQRIPGLEAVPGPPPAPPPAPVPAPAPSSKKALWTGVALGAGGLIVVAGMMAENPPAEAPVGPAPQPFLQQPDGRAPAPSPAPSPAPTPAPSPAPAPAAPVSLQGVYQPTDAPEVRLVLQHQGGQVNMQAQSNGQVFGHGVGAFDGQRVVMQVQFEMLGQPLMQGQCTLMWQPQPGQLQGPCQWPVGNEIVTWRRVGG
jgi:TIR domain